MIIYYWLQLRMLVNLAPTTVLYFAGGALDVREQHLTQGS